MFTVSFSSQSSPSCASFCHTFPLESSWWSIESHHFESHIWVTMKWFISYSQRVFFSMVRMLSRWSALQHQLRRGGFPDPEKNRCHPPWFLSWCLSMEGRNKWLVGGLEHEFYDFPKSWDVFFQSDFHSIIFQGGCFTKPHKQPTRWWFSMIFLGIKAWHHGRMGPWIARTLHPSSRMSTVGGSTRRTAAMSTVGEAPQLD